MTGYRGRIGIYELLEIDSILADAIRRGDVADFARLAKQQHGFVSLVQRALNYALEHTTSIEEVMRVTSGLEEEELSTSLLKDVLSSVETAPELALPSIA
jgi:MSHA biogenesis protein MshE